MSIHRQSIRVVTASSLLFHQHGKLNQLFITLFEALQSLRRARLRQTIMLAIKTSIKSSVMIFALLDIACLLALASLVYGDDHGHHAGYGGAPTAARASSGYQQQQSNHHQQAGGYRHHRTDSGSQEQYQQGQESAGPTNYQFAYTAKAKGGPSAASYGGSGEYASGRTAATGDDTSVEFGHTETHNDGRTEGKYFVQLPDGRLQSVVYHVEGDSGFVAEVQYEGGDQQQSGEHHNRQHQGYSATQGSHLRAAPAAGGHYSAGQGVGGYSATRAFQKDGGSGEHQQQQGRVRAAAGASTSRRY